LPASARRPWPMNDARRKRPKQRQHPRLNLEVQQNNLARSEPFE
jgi:hypothetical protein